MNWILLVLAGLCECGFTFSLGKANLATGSRQITWYAVFVIFYALSMVLLAKAVKTIPIGTAYPVWTGIGAVGTVLLGIIVFREPFTLWRMLFTFMLITSIIGLKMVQ